MKSPKEEAVRRFVESHTEMEFECLAGTEEWTSAVSHKTGEYYTFIFNSYNGFLIVSKDVEELCTQYSDLGQK